MNHDLETRLRADLPRLATTLIEAPLVQPVATRPVTRRRRPLLVAVLAASVILAVTITLAALAVRHDHTPAANNPTARQPSVWQALAHSPLGPRAGVNPIWTGSEVLVWGGNRGSLFLQDGAAYNPSTKTWRSLTSNQWAFPSTISVWAGDHYVVLAKNGGATYTPSTDTWQDLPRLPDSLNGAFVGVAWTGTDLLGIANGPHGVFVARYDPTHNTWISGPVQPGSTPTADAPVSIVWLDTHLIYWDATNRGWTYTPATTKSWSWQKLPALPSTQLGTSSSIVNVAGRLVVAYTTNTPTRQDLVVGQLTNHHWKTIATMPAGQLTQPVAVATHDAVIVVDRAGRNAPIEVSLRTGKHAVLAGYPLAPGADTAAVWTGQGLFVWGGYPTSGTTSQNTGSADAAWHPRTG